MEITGEQTVEVFSILWNKCIYKSINHCNYRTTIYCSLIHKNFFTVKGPKADIPNNSVNAQREKFEQGLNTQALENNILRNTYLERQRELDMLRSRFNRNKEMAQAAAGSCIRTSESSEGKSNSPKNSPVCPVKPTPAPVSEHLIFSLFVNSCKKW